MNKKKIWSTLLAFAVVAAIVFALGGIANAEPAGDEQDTATPRSGNEKCGDNLTWNIEPSGLLRITGSGDMYNYTYGSRAPWDEYSDQITDVGLADTVTSIGDYAFCEIAGLTSFVIPQNITYIGEDAFYGCENIENVYCYANPADMVWDEAGNDDFKDNVFEDEMTVLHILSGFYDTGHLTTNCVITYDLYRANGSCGENITWGIDGNYMLCIEGEGAMTDFASESSVPWIKYSDKIKLIDIEYSVTSIGDYAFANMTSCTSVRYSRNKQDVTIGAHAFKGCSSLEFINNNSGEPSSVLYITSIGDGAFEGCSSLPVFYLSARAGYIGDNAFKNCTGLTEFSIPAYVTYIGEDAFKGCTNISLVNCYANPDTLETWADEDCDDFMPSGATKCYVASKYYYDFCDIFSHVNISFASHTIDNGGFCGNNATYFIDGDGTLYVNGTGPMADYNSNNDTPWDQYRKMVTRIVIAEGITTIGKNAFCEFNNLLTVEIPSTVTSIGDWGFGNALAMEPLTIPSTVKSIGDHAFNCVNFDSIIISEGVERIGKYAFADTFLKSVTVPASVTYLGEGAFEESKLESVTILANISKIEEATFYSCSKLSSVTLPESVKTIGTGAFYNSGLTTVDFLDGVETIDIFAFAYCGNLSSVIIPDTVTTIDDSAFYGNKNLVSVTLPSSLTFLGESAFQDSGLKSITIPGNIKTISKSAFAESKDLMNVTILNGVEKIDDYAFSGCNNLVTVTIPASVKYIGDDAFWNCTRVTDVYCYAVPDDDFDWPEGRFDDFSRNSSARTKCHVCSEYLDTYLDRFYYKVNVDFTGDLVPSIGETLKGYSLSLDGDIALNFYMSVDEALAASDTAKVVFTISSLDGSKTKTQTVYVNPQSDANRNSAYIEDGYYVFKCRVAAKEMTSIITAQMVDGNSKGNKYEYSVQKYGQFILNHYYIAKYEDAKEIVKAMLNYGAYSQLYFNYNLENLANSVFEYEYEREVDMIDVSELRAFSGSTLVGTSGLKLKSANLELESETVLNLYFTGIEGCDHLNFRLDDGTAEGKALRCVISDDGSGNGIAKVTITNIPICFINNDFKVDVYEGTGYAGSITYSPMNYCYNVISRPVTATRTEALKLDISAYILFYQKSVEYSKIV